MLNSVIAKTLRRSAAWAALAAASINAAQAQPLELDSGDTPVQLLELYTSQGCSSCPPAEAWMSELQNTPDLWRRLVPIAWHVQYWDRLGWEDRFGRAEAEKRQRGYVVEGGAKQVYTPAFILHGYEWRPRADGIANVSSHASGRLRASVDARDLRVRFVPQRPSDRGNRLEAHIALLGFGLTTQILRGENQSKTLTEDFVVLQHSTFPLRLSSDPTPTATDIDAIGATPTAQEFTGLTAVPRDPDIKGKKAIAIWVTSSDRQAPLQAVGGWLPDSPQ